MEAADGCVCLVGVLEDVGVGGGGPTVGGGRLLLLLWPRGIAVRVFLQGKQDKNKIPRSVRWFDKIQPSTKQTPSQQNRARQICIAVIYFFIVSLNSFILTIKYKINKKIAKQKYIFQRFPSLEFKHFLPGRCHCCRRWGCCGWGRGPPWSPARSCSAGSASPPAHGRCSQGPPR